MKKFIDFYCEYIMLAMFMVINIAVTLIYYYNFLTNNIFTDVILMLIILFSAFKIFILKIDIDIILSLILYYLTYHLEVGSLKYIYGVIFILLLIFLIIKIINIILFLVYIFE